MCNMLREWTKWRVRGIKDRAKKKKGQKEERRNKQHDYKNKKKTNQVYSEQYIYIYISINTENYVE